MGPPRPKPQKLSSLQALNDNNLLNTEMQINSLEDFNTKGVWEQGDTEAGADKKYFIYKALCPLCCANFCGFYQLFVVSPGCVMKGLSGGSDNKFFGPGVHMIWSADLVMDPGEERIATTPHIQKGTKNILTVREGTVGHIENQGKIILLPPGYHSWDNQNYNFREFFDLGQPIIPMGPLTLVTVEECYAGISVNNGRIEMLPGGGSYMLMDWSHKMNGSISLKMQTQGMAEQMPTADNIMLNVRANVTWIVQDAELAAMGKIDATKGGDPLAQMRTAINESVLAQLGMLIGKIQYGMQGVTGVVRAVRREGEPEPNTQHDTYSRMALWDNDYLIDVRRGSNKLINQYGAEVLQVNIITAAPTDPSVQQAMAGGAIATVQAEETTKEARAEAMSRLIDSETEGIKAQADADAAVIQATAAAQAETIKVQGDATRARAAANALVVNATAEAEAYEIRAKAESEATIERAKGSRDAGIFIGKSEVAASLAQLEEAYKPFKKNETNSFFFGLSGPGELPDSILGKELAINTGAKS